MPARKPQSLNRRHDTNADKARRAAREASVRPRRGLPSAPPAQLAGHRVAGATWRRLVREYSELDAEIVTRLDIDLLVDYCLLMEQVTELDHMRRVAYQLWLELSGKHDELVKEDRRDAAVELAVSVVGAFDVVCKLDARADVKRKVLMTWRQSLYLTPRARAGVAPRPKAAPEPEDDLERLLRGVDLDADEQ